MNKPSQKLIDAVIEQMKSDIDLPDKKLCKEIGMFSDWTSIDELLSFCPVENLIAYLPEEQWKKFKK